MWAELTKMADTYVFIVMQKILKTCITFSEMNILSELFTKVTLNP